MDKKFQKQVDAEFMLTHDYANTNNIQYFRGTQSYHFTALGVALRNFFAEIAKGASTLIKTFKR